MEGVETMAIKKAAVIVIAVVPLVGVWDTWCYLKASDRDTISAYSAYINQRPIPALLWKSAALDGHDDTMFEAACAEDTSEAYGNYLRMSSRKLHQDEALERREAGMLRWAMEQGTVKALTNYIDEFPEGQLISELDDGLYLAAEKAGTISAMRAYLSRFKAGKNTRRAAAAIRTVSDAAFGKYQKLAREREADRGALDIMKAAASFVNKTDRRTLQISFVGIDDTSISPLRSHDWAGVENQVTEYVVSALGKMFDRDVIRAARANNQKTNGLRLQVKYKLTTTGTEYSSAGSLGANSDDAHKYKEVRFDWEFRLVVPGNPPEKHSFAFSTKPGLGFATRYKRGRYDVDSSPSVSEVYDAMFSAAVQHVQTEFTSRFGL
jgi:hypothetical protein